MTHSPEFSHIERTIDARFPHPVAIVLTGQYFASRDPMLGYTVLGSCIAVCACDPVSRVGGLNHFLLPEPTGTDRDDPSTRYGSNATQRLLDALQRYGARRDRLEVKLFGGGHLACELRNVGQENIDWIRAFCRREGFAPLSTDLGGMMARCVYYETATGRALIRRIPLEPRPYPPGRRGLHAEIPSVGEALASFQGDVA